MTKRTFIGLGVAAVAALSLPGAARAGDVVVPEDAVVAAAAKAERSTVVLRITRGSTGTSATALLDSVRLQLEAARDTALAVAKSRAAASAGTPASPAPTPPPATIVERDADGNTTLRFGEPPVSARLAARWNVLGGASGLGVGTTQARGVFVGDGHVVLTAAVAVDGATKVEVLRDGGAVEAVVAGLDRDFDVALLKTAASGPAVEIDDASDLEPGRVVILAGASESGGGIDVRFVSSRGGPSPRRGYGRLSTSVPATAVGAPAFGPDGRLRGIVAGHAGLSPQGAYAGCAACHGTAGWAPGWAARTDPTNGIALLYEALAQRGPHRQGWTTVADQPADDAAPAVAHLVPGRRIARAVRDLLADGRVKKAYFGIVLDRVDGADVGADARRVAQVLPGSPAEGRLLAGDRILAVGGKELAASDDVTYEILSLEPGRASRIAVERSAAGAAPARVELEVTPTERREDASTRGPLVFGFDALPLTPELRVWLGRAEGDGLVISAVTRGGAAERAGFARGDRVLRLAGRAVATPADLAAAVDDALRALAAGSAVTLDVERDGAEISRALHAAAGAPKPGTK